ncbi:MAG: prolyl oligopeptidase family serine peptidase [Bacteroidota bacterium]|nr:prolyl oligopeptidase family serine peptidase [Bacteroidota bacterium]MDP4252686.1 prolyl oligopeptidase family serine peptidase [Bacteroidota bacterium]
MKYRSLFLAGMLIPGSTRVLAQKPVLDTTAINNWRLVEEGGILSPDGKYAGYADSKLYGAEYSADRVYFIKSTYGSWEKRIAGVEKAQFTADSREAAYIQGDTLHIITLGSNEDKAIPGVSAYQLFKKGNDEGLLCYFKADRKVVIRGEDRRETAYSDVDGWLLSSDGTTLLIRSNHDKEGQIVSRVNIGTGESQTIWEGSPVKDWVMSESGGQIAFSTKDQVGLNHIFVCRAGQDKAADIANDHSEGIDRGLTIGKLLNFSKDGSRLFFNLVEELPKPDPNKISVDVWSYFDPKIQAEQLQDNAWRHTWDYLSLIRLDRNPTVVRLQQKGEKMDKVSADGNYVVLDETQGDMDSRWSRASQFRYEIVDTRNGKRSVIGKYRFLGFSASGRFLQLYDRSTGDYFVYELATGVLHPLTANVPVSPALANDDAASIGHRASLGISGWLSGDEAVLVNDYYDLWELDPTGRKAPINLTSFQGAKTKTTFYNSQPYRREPVSGDTMILSAFNHDTKENGFYRVVLHRQQVPQKISMGPYAYFAPSTIIEGLQPFVKASKASVYMVKRQSSSEASNYFVTTDFKAFHPVSDDYPEKSFNWMRTKLLLFKTVAGRKEQGVLYMPENFDPGRQYPLIVYYYEVKSDYLNGYHRPTDNHGDLNIPWFTSHGYLVFTPDFHYKLGSAGESVLQTVEGALKLLKSFPYVDGKHMGLQGHSFGGFETNFLVTHTHEFAAAVSSAGPSDWVSAMVAIDFFGTCTPDFVQYSQGRMGTTLWENPDYYIRNSPVFYADKATTPILLVANKRDRNVSFTQGLEFFTALRRLGKKAWMLQYDREDHGEFHKPEQIDCLVRSTQFFDHYLKGAPAPKWMVEGIPATMKQVDNGLELEPAGVEPGPGLLTPEAQKAVDALKNRKPITLIFN